MAEADRQTPLPEDLITVELCPAEGWDKLALQEYEKLPLTAANAIGSGLRVFPTLNNRFGKIAKAGKGLYRVRFEPGALGQLAASEVKHAIGREIVKETTAALAAAAVQPSVFAAAAPLITLGKRLDAINRTHEAIRAFLIQQNEVRLLNDLNTLSETLEDYRANWNSDAFKSGRHPQIQQIRRASEQELVTCRVQIEALLRPAPALLTEQTLKKRLAEAQTRFRCYQLTVDLFAFASFLELLLLDDFSEAHLQRVRRKISDEIDRYERCFRQSGDRISAMIRASVQSRAIDRMAKAKKSMGEAVARLPVVGASRIDENLLATSQRYETLETQRAEAIMADFRLYLESGAQIFLEKIEAIDALYHQSAEFLLDGDDVYLKTKDGTT